MFKQGCPACEYAAEKKSERLLFDGGQKFALIVATLFIGVLHVLSIRYSVPTEVAVVVIGIVVEVLLALFWCVYISNNVIGWRGPGTFLNQLGDVHTHLFLSNVLPSLFHRSAKAVYSSDDFRVCSPLAFVLTSGWFRRPSVWLMMKEGDRRRAVLRNWRVRVNGERWWVTDPDDARMPCPIDEALELVADGRPLCLRLYAAQKGLASKQASIEELQRELVQQKKSWQHLGHSLTALLVAARMEKAARPSPQARWISGALFQVLEAHWQLPDVMTWINLNEIRHREARATIADFVAQAEQRRVEESSTQSGSHILGIAG